MFLTSLVVVSYSLLRVKHFDSKKCRPVVMNMTSKNILNLRAITVDHAARIFSWFGDSVAINMSTATTELYDFRPCFLKCLGIVSRKNEKVLRT